MRKKTEHWSVEIIITRDREVIYQPRKRPPSSKGAAAAIVAFSPRSRKAIAGKVSA
jgi:hypothetical protein